MIKITESPRNALLALKSFIPTIKKIEYINELIKVGFNVIDIGSFVSEDVVPQMRDTGEVIEGIDLINKTEVSVRVEDIKNAHLASDFDKVTYINYPFAISETLQKRNFKSNLNQSLKPVDEIINICIKKGKGPVISLISAFGNPYDDDWGIDILMEWIDIFYEKGLRYISLADTTGSGNTHLIGLVLDNVIREYSDVEFNLHLHSKSEESYQKITAAYDAGCRSFDSMISEQEVYQIAEKELVSNLSTRDLLSWLEENKIEHKIKDSFFNVAIEKAASILNG